MKSTRFSRPKGHFGTALTFSMPFGLLGWAAAAALGHPYLGPRALWLECWRRVSPSLLLLAAPSLTIAAGSAFWSYIRFAI